MATKKKRAKIKGKAKKVRAKKSEKIVQKPEKTAVFKEDLKQKRTKIKIIGIGDGGSAIVADLARELGKIDFWAANTDWRRLQRFPSTVKVFNFGEKYTRGVGTGMDPEIGRQAALSEKEKIAKILRGSDLCFLISSLGGGTGSGATPVFAKIARQEGILSFGIFTLPFKFEGEKKIEIARESLERMRTNLNATLIFPNEKIFQNLDKNISFNQGFSAVNKALSQGLKGLIGLVFQPGLINIDFADLKTILEGKGKPAYLVDAEFEKGSKTEEIRKKVFQNTFLTYSFRRAKAILFNITSDNNLALGEVSEISQLVFGAVHPEAKIIFGVSFNNKILGKIRVTLLAIGGREKSFERNDKKPKEKKPKTLQKKKKDSSKEKEKTEQQKLDVKIRRNALQVKEEAKAEEETIAAKERLWETPAILRKEFLSN